MLAREASEDYDNLYNPVIRFSYYFQGSNCSGFFLRTIFIIRIVVTLIYERSITKESRNNTLKFTQVAKWSETYFVLSMSISLRLSGDARNSFSLSLILTQRKSPRLFCCQDFRNFQFIVIKPCGLRKNLIYLNCGKHVRSSMASI